jgi:photosystem II stability/assembly factor-like uncharacterized protein
MRVLRLTLFASGIVAVFVIAAIVVAAPQHEESVVTADFDSGRTEGWELTENATLRDGMLQLFGPGHAFWFEAHGADFGLGFRIRFGEGAGEVVLKASGEPPHHRLYALRFFGPELELVRISGGDELGMGAAPVGMAPGTWHRVNVSISGGQIQIAVDGRPVVRAFDPQPLPPGATAFGCIAGGGFAYDDLEYMRTDGTALHEMISGEPHRPPPVEGHTEEDPMMRADPMIQEEPVAHTTEPLSSGEPIAGVDPMIEAEPTAELGEVLSVEPVVQAKLMLRSVPVGPESPKVAVLDRIPAHALGQLQRAYAWERLGGPLGGLGYDVRMRPGNPLVMYVSDAWAGVFKSHNGGATWYPANNGIKNRRGEARDAIPIFCLTIDPKRPETVWVGAQNERGVYRTDNGGQLWHRRENGILESNGITIRGFAVHPVYPDTVFMGAEILSWAWNKRLNNVNKPIDGKNFDKTMGVLYKTTDGGQSWKAVRYFDNLVRYILFDPTNPKTMYLSTGIFDREARNTNEKQGFAGGVGVFKSTDGGTTWKQANNGIGNLYVGTLFMHPTDPKILLAGTGCNPWQQGAGVYLTTDGAKSWQQTLSGDVITSVEFATSDPLIAYAGSSGRIYRSANGGRSWVPMTQGKHSWGPPGIRAGWPIDFQVDPSNPNRVFANNYGGGNFLSNDGGATWSDASRGYTGALIRDVSAGSDGTVWAAGRSGVFVSTDGGATWKGMNHGPAIELDWPVVEADPLDRSHVIAGSLWNAPLYERRGLRSQWRLAHKLNPQPYRRVGWTEVVFAPSNSRVVFAGTGGVAPFGQLQSDLPGMGIYRSVDGGASWSPANDSLSATAHVQELLVHPDNHNRVWAATSTHGVLITADGGQSWAQGHRGLPPNARALSIAGRPPWQGELFVGLDRAGLYRSTDWGENWKPFMHGMNPNAMVSDIVVDPTDTRVIYAADRISGVYIWEPGVNQWRRINSQLHNRDVNALSVTPDGAYLYAGTEGSGVYRVRIPP